MKLKGIQSGKVPGTRRGDPIPLSPEEKARAALTDAMAAKSTADIMFLVDSATIEEVYTHPARDLGPNRKPDPRLYDAKGSVVYREHPVASARTAPRKTARFNMRFQDCPDDLGQPDLKTLRFELV